MKEILYNDKEYIQVTENGEEWYDESLSDIAYQELVYVLDKMDRGKKIKIEAELGLWNGKHKVSAVADTFREAFEKCLLLRSEQYVEVVKTGEHSVRVTIAHHDGTNHYLLKDY